LRAYLRPCYWVNALLLVLRFFLHPDKPWLRRLAAALAGLLLGLLLVFVWGLLNHFSVRRLAADLRQAYDTRDARAMEQLFCWEGVDDKTRARVRLVILQEFELPVETVSVRPLTLLDRNSGPGLRPNLKPAATVEVIYASPDHLSSAFLVGRDGWWRHRLVVMVPAN